jgi:hypothetical protein
MNKSQDYGGFAKNKTGAVWLPWNYWRVREDTQHFEIILIRTRKNIGGQDHRFVSLA